MVAALNFLCKRGFCMLDRTEYENYWYAFQQKLDKLLDERNMSHLELSIKLGKSPGYIHDVLSRRIDPSTISLFAMAAYFNCPIIECAGAPVESLDTLFRVLRLFFFMVSTSRLRLVMNTHFFNIK